MSESKAGNPVCRQNHRLSRLSTALIAAVMSLCMAISLGPLGSGVSQAAVPSALAAKTFTLNENGDLRLTSKQGFTLNERGPASGTVSGTIYVHLRIVSTTRVTAEVSIYPHRGSITGSGVASYHRAGATASFSGSLTIDRGTGSYNHARGSGLSFSGTIQRSNDAVNVHVGGRVSD